MAVTVAKRTINYNYPMSLGPVSLGAAGGPCHFTGEHLDPAGPIVQWNREVQDDVLGCGAPGQGGTRPKERKEADLPAKAKDKSGTMVEKRFYKTHLSGRRGLQVLEESLSKQQQQ